MIKTAAQFSATLYFNRLSIDRTAVEGCSEKLIALLDDIDGDPDFEPETNHRIALWAQGGGPTAEERAHNEKWKRIESR